MPTSTPNLESAVEIAHVSYQYPPTGFDAKQSNALVDINLTIEQGSKLGILGPNGGGKSTLIKLILGLLKPESGSIRVFGHSPTRARELGLIGYLPQRIESDLAWPISVHQVVSLGLACKRKPWEKLSQHDHASIDRALALLQISDLRDRPIGALSGGQLQRAMIARSIASIPKLLVLDEPMVGVDISGQQRFGSLIETLRNELDLTIIIVTHDMRAIAAVADRVACLSRTLHFHDSPDGLTPAVLAQVFAHDVAGVFGELHIDAHAADECEDPSHQQAHKHTHTCDHDSHDHKAHENGHSKGDQL